MKDNMSGPSRRQLLKSAGVTATAGLVGVAGCMGGEDDSGVTPVEEDTLTVWHAMGGGLGDALEELGDQFQEETGVEVSMEFQDSYEDTLTNLLSALDSGNVPDLCQIDSLHAKQVLDTEAVEPVEELLPDDFPTDDFLPNVTDFFVIDETLYSLPFNNSNAIMYYNRSAFEEAGLDPDSPPETLEDVREYSETLVDEGVTDYGITWPNHIWFVEHWYSLQGELLFDEENGHAGDPSTIHTDTETGQELYEWWRGMAEDDLYSNPGIEAWGEATSTFLTETAGMLLTSTAFVAGASEGAEEEGFEVDNAFYPTISDRTGVVIGGASFFVPSGLPDDRREDIGDLLAFLATPESQVQWHQETGYYPIRQEAVDQLEQEGWFEENPMFRTAMDQLTESDQDDPATKRMLVGPARQVQTTVQDKSVEIFEEHVSVEEGLEDIKTTVEEELESY